MTNNNNVTEVYNVRNIAWTASNVNKLLATLAVYSLLSGCGGSGDSDSTPAAKPPIENKKDETPPVITLEGGNSITVYLGNVFEDPGYSATDNVDGDISKRVKVSDYKQIDTGTVGSYTLTYKVTDTAGNEATAKRVVEVVEGIVFRDSTITLYENEYQHRIWYDVKSDNIDASTITVKLSNQSTATVEKEQGKMLDVELVEVKDSTSKSGYFTLAIHDDEEFEGKEMVVAEVFSNDVFVKELSIELDDTDEKNIPGYKISDKPLSEIIEQGQRIINDRHIAVGDNLYSIYRILEKTDLQSAYYTKLDVFYLIAKYDLIQKKEIKIAINKGDYKNKNNMYVVVNQGEIYLFDETHLYRLHNSDLSLEVISEAPKDLNIAGVQKNAAQVVNGKLYLFSEESNYSFDFKLNMWEPLPHPSLDAQELVFGEVRATRVVKDKIHVYSTQSRMIFDTTKNTWSAKAHLSSLGSELGVDFRFIGQYVYDFMDKSVKENKETKKTKAFRRYSFSNHLWENGEERLDVGLSNPFMYKGRIYMHTKAEDVILPFYWGDNH
ncbi:immunoglobulin-like domain-containing protein [Vibrio campbellii]|uniref:immunoglobulin-like domain-containing protein n=1 Tax=Vibrio campbellii TaxID=680 RepID=UPI001F262C68|nr:DUF5011 domain-containing protein [Vibrio campbellii]MCE7729015.1 DUF5011 domain-containing protein [Vibrio campbellii]